MNISGVSDYDYVKLIATWFYNVETKYNCGEIIERLKNMPNSETRILDLQTRNGCNFNSKLSGLVDKPSGTVRYRQDNVCYYNCFCNFVDVSTTYLLNLFWNYERGFLPFSGTITEQPAKIMEVFNIFAHLKNEKMKAEQKKTDQQNKKGR